MFEVTASVSVKMDMFPDIKKAIEDLQLKDVLIGIPQESSGNSGEITNAEKLYVNTHGVRNIKMREEMQNNIDKGKSYSKAHEMYLKSHGSPLLNIPARPVLEPAIEDAKEPISNQLKKVLEVALDGEDTNIELQKAGMIGQNAARVWFTNAKNNWAPNSPITIAKKGSDKVLIDTGEMRKAITYIVQDRK